MNPVSYIKKHKVMFASLILVFLFLVVFMADSIFVYVLPGQAGLLFQAFSSRPFSDKVYPPGLYVILPWNKMYIHDLTKQKLTREVYALTKNGLQVKIKVTALYRPNPARLRDLTLTIGADYASKIMIPAISASTREIIGLYPPEALYTTAVHTLQQQIWEAAQRDLAGMAFIVDDVVIEELTLPKSLNQAIENKLRQQQEALAYQFILQKERDEAKRRQIEAESINAYQKTINGSLNEQVLRWMEIRAMADLGKSKNGKVVVFGGSRDQAPVLINPEGKGD